MNTMMNIIKIIYDMDDEEFAALILILIAIINAIRSQSSGAYLKKDKLINLFAMVSLHLQLLIGFALETNNEMEHAIKKLVNKNFDFIVLNSLQDKNAGFQHDTNKITIIHKSEKVIKYPLKTKTKVAEDIVNEVVEILN